MIRCVRLWTGDDGASHVEIGSLDIASGRNADLVSENMPATHVTLEETAGAARWRGTPRRCGNWS